MDVDGLSVYHCSAQRPTTVHRSNFLLPVNWDRSMRGYKPKLIIVSTPNCSVACVAQPCSVLCNHVEHRLNIGRRTSNDTQDLTRRGLLLQRLSQLAVTILQFLEQPHVLDGDHRLVRKGCDKLDLLVGERPCLRATECDDAQQVVSTEHRHPQRCPIWLHLPGRVGVL